MLYAKIFSLSAPNDSNQRKSNDVFERVGVTEGDFAGPPVASRKYQRTECRIGTNPRTVGRFRHFFISVLIINGTLTLNGTSRIVYCGDSGNFGVLGIRFKTSSDEDEIFTSNRKL
ncbi:uncharacterized protein LOC144474390 [Augochlora pura]